MYHPTANFLCTFLELVDAEISQNGPKALSNRCLAYFLPLNLSKKTSWYSWAPQIQPVTAAQGRLDAPRHEFAMV